MFGLFCSFYGLMGVYKTQSEAEQGKNEYWNFIRDSDICALMVGDETLSYEEAEEKAKKIFDSGVGVEYVEDGGY